VCFWFDAYTWLEQHRFLQVDLVQRDRQQFAHIDDEELGQRTSYIATTKQALAAISADYKVPAS